MGSALIGPQQERNQEMEKAEAVRIVRNAGRRGIVLCVDSIVWCGKEQFGVRAVSGPDTCLLHFERAAMPAEWFGKGKK